MKDKYIYLNFGTKGIGINFDIVRFNKVDPLIHFYLCGHLVFSLNKDELKHKLIVDHNRFLKHKIYYDLNMGEWILWNLKNLS